jgi:large conductance mechanosensitive channel
MQKKEEAAPAPVTTKECPLYISQIAIKATRCPCCTGEAS